MLMLYFSGTGNSKYIAQLFAEKTGAACHSIEENLDFAKEIEKEDVLAVCYPIYASCVPRIMREFVETYATQIAKKKLIIFCTQLMFSGDGACAFTRLLQQHAPAQILYAEHFNMPNNICNFALFPVKNGDAAKKYLHAAEKKMNRVCKHLAQNIVRKRGFGAVSALLGKIQNASWPAIEAKNASGVQVDSDCVRCGMCVQQCPMKNLSLSETGVTQHDACMMCYRCVNICPKQAITVLLHKKPWVQYSGVQHNQ